MLANGTLTVAEAATIFKRQAWPPDLADKAAAARAPGGATTTTHPDLEKAQGHQWTTLQREYTKGDGIRADTEAALATLIPNATTRAAVFAVWDVERGYVT
jgi:hypothetical protein